MNLEKIFGKLKRSQTITEAALPKESEKSPGIKEDKYLFTTPTNSEMNEFFESWISKNRINTEVWHKEVEGKTIATEGYWNAVNYTLYKSNIRLTVMEAIVLSRLENSWNLLLTPQSFAKINNRLKRQTLWEIEASEYASNTLLSEFGKVQDIEQIALKRNLLFRILPHMKFVEVDKKTEVAVKLEMMTAVRNSLIEIPIKNIERFLQNYESEFDYNDGIQNLINSVASQIKSQGTNRFNKDKFNQLEEAYNPAMTEFILKTKEILLNWTPQEISRINPFYNLTAKLITPDTIYHFGAAYNTQGDAIANFIQEILKCGVFDIENDNNKVKLILSKGFKEYLASI